MSIVWLMNKSSSLSAHRIESWSGLLKVQQEAKHKHNQMALNKLADEG